MIYLSSDLHFGHDREFLWGPRGFNSIEENDNTILKNFKEILKDEDDLYLLGDLMLLDNESGIEKLKQIPGKIHIILGNHDSSDRIKLYEQLPQVQEIVYATKIKYKKCHFFLSHYPTITSNYDDNKSYHQNLINLHGHTHQKTNFYFNNEINSQEIKNPYMYHVGVDSHDCKPVLLDDIIDEIKAYRCDLNNMHLTK